MTEGAMRCNSESKMDRCKLEKDTRDGITSSLEARRLLWAQVFFVFSFLFADAVGLLKIFLSGKCRISQQKK